MHVQMAGGELPLQEMIQRHIAESQAARGQMKLASDDKDKDDKKQTEADKAKIRAVGNSKKDDKEKKAGAFSTDDHEGLNKFAHALKSVGIKLASDTINNGGESKQGGEQVPVLGRILGTQKYTRDGSKKHQVPMSTPMQTQPENGPAATQVWNDANKKPGGSAVQGQIKAASSRQYLLGKIAEATGGGMTLDSKSGQNVSVPMPSAGGNGARSGIESNQAAINFTKRQAKAPMKSQLTQVLTEPAMSASTDNKINENLANAPKAGVKIASAAKRALLEKIASNPNDPRYQKLQAALSRISA